MAGAGIQSAAAFNESIIRLQMVDQLARAWAVQWPSMPMGRGAAADAGNQSREEMMQDLQVLSALNCMPKPATDRDTAVLGRQRFCASSKQPSAVDALL